MYKSTSVHINCQYITGLAYLVIKASNFPTLSRVQLLIRQSRNLQAVTSCNVGVGGRLCIKRARRLWLVPPTLERCVSTPH